MLAPSHQRRLRDVWRSAGWPYQDGVEAELIAAGLLEQRWDSENRVTVHLTRSGIDTLADVLNHHRKRRDAHEALVRLVASAMAREGRVVWCGLKLLAPVPEQSSWVMAMPDVFSIRHTSRPEYLDPTAHEIKVNRADLLADLRRPEKAQVYLAAAGQCWYVIRQGIGEPEEIPAEFGVLVADADDLKLVRPAPRLHSDLPFMTWMALARSSPTISDDRNTQVELIDADRSVDICLQA